MLQHKLLLILIPSLIPVSVTSQKQQAELVFKGTMRLNSVKQSCVFLCLVTLAVFLFLPAFSQAVTVGPVKLEYKVDPGATLNGQLFLQNDGSETQTFYPSFDKFTEDSSGNKNFTKETSDLATWFKIASSVTLKVGESNQVPFIINVPKNAPPGGHFAVIWWSNSPPSGNGQQVSIVTRAGILVYLTVSGQVQEEGSITSFLPQTIFFTSTPVNFSLTFKNSGNTYLKPGGSLEIKNIFGSVLAETAINPFGENIFPGTYKTFDLALNPGGFLFGIYHTAADVSYGEINPQTVSVGAWIIIAPWGTLIGFIIILFLIFFGIPFGIKRYNAWIVRKMTGKIGN